MSKMSNIVIGKVPGYNKEIDTTDKMFAKRLTQEFTKIRLTPIGYQINFGSSEKKLTNASSGIYHISQGLSGNILSNVVKSTEDGKDVITKSNTEFSTASALEAWQQLIAGAKVQSKLNQLLKNECSIIDILCTNDSTLTETFSNNFGKTNIETLAEGVIGKTLGIWKNKINGLKTAVTGLDSGMGLALLKKTGGDDILSLLMNKSFDMQTSLPQEWKSSDYSNQIQIMIKLVSPTGDEASINEYILKPLTYLIMMTAPITTTGVFYGYPPLWKVEASGLMDMKVAGISNMTITRGGTETQFNMNKQPLNVDIRMTITPLIPGFASPIGKDHGLYSGTLDNPNMIVQSYNDITDSFKIKDYNKINIEL